MAFQLKHPGVAFGAGMLAGALLCVAVVRDRSATTLDAQSVTTPTGSSSKPKLGAQAYAMSLGLILPPEPVPLATFHNSEGPANCAAYVKDLKESFPNRSFWCE